MLQVVQKGKEEITGQVVIISYDLVSKCIDRLRERKFGMIVLDESHCIKSEKSLRSQALCPLVRQTKRAVLLTGTAALAKPIELFTQAPPPARPRGRGEALRLAGGGKAFRRE